MSRRMGEEAAFLDHLEILRRKVLISAGVVVAAAAAAFGFAGAIVDVLRFPMAELDVELIYIKPQEKLVTYLRVSLFAGLLAGIPFLVLQAASFVAPGLTRKEKLWFLPSVAAVLLLFLGGVAAGFLVLAPFALRFLAGFASEGELMALWSIGGYVQFVVALTLVCGLLFLLPMALFFLFAAEIVSVDSAARARKYVVLGIFLTAAVLTPPDPFTQVAVGLVLYGLYELALAAGKLAQRKRRGNDG